MGHAQGLSMLYLEARCISRRARRRLAGRPERLDLVRRAGARRAGRHARDPGRERDRGLARPRGRLRQRRDRLALGDPQDGEADGPVPAGDGLRHLRLLGHAPPRQHVRRRQLRRGRPRRVADDPARLAGRRRASSRLAEDERRRGARARRRGPSRRCSTSSASRRSRDEEVEAATVGYDSRDLPDRDRAADVEAADAALERGVRRSTSRARSTAHGFGDVAEAVVACSASASSADYLQTSAVIDAAGPRPLRRQRPERLPRPGHGLPARGRALGAAAARCRTRSTPRGSATRRRRPRRCCVERGEAARGRATRTRSSSRSGRRSARSCARRSTASPTPTCSRRSATASGRRARAAPRPRPPRRRRRVHRPRRRAAVRLGDRASGLQSKGTALIHRADLQPLDNLELFGMSPLYSLGVVPRDRAQRGRLRARPAASGRCRPSSTTSRAPR